MSNVPASERAEELSRRRARMLPFLAIIYFSQQATFFSALDPAGHESARMVKIGAWLLLSAVLLAALTTKAFWLERREVRNLIDDENTRANRLEAIRYGFIAAMLMTMATYLLVAIEPITAPEAAHLILSAGLGVALLRFGFLERRAHRDG